MSLPAAPSHDDEFAHEKRITGASVAPDIAAFFDEPTFTVSYVVSDPTTGDAVIIDPVLDFDPASGRTAHASANKLLEFVANKGLTVRFILETHVHADHLTAAQYLREKTGASIGIGSNITLIQETFAEVFNIETGFSRDGSQFDRLFADGDTFNLGNIAVDVIHTPGHTPNCSVYKIGDAVFVGDTLFMPDFGTARCDFPGGDARTLYQSIHRILALPGDTRLFMCHDYQAPGRPRYAWETTVAEERADNIHVHDGISEADFVAMREQRDATLSMPKLILPAVQVNIRAGEPPPAESNGISYLKLPLDAL
jgi:glyoxylase-like metal-dependent hydrolase (beta-lactamase superfamily II)